MSHLLLIIIIIILSSPSSSSSSPLNNLTFPKTSPSWSFLNLTKILYSSHNFFTAASEFQSHRIDIEIDTRDAMTIFTPDDNAFNDSSVSKRYKSLSPENKYLVLSSHILTHYLPPALLPRTTNVWKLQETLATGIMGHNKYTINITAMVNGSVTVSNDIVLAVVTRTLYDRSPVVVYAVSKVLIPKEFPHISPPAPITSDVASPTVYCFKFNVVLLLLLVIWI